MRKIPLPTAAGFLMGNGQWTMDNGQWTMDNGQWTMDNGQLWCPYEMEFRLFVTEGQKDALWFDSLS